MKPFASILTDIDECRASPCGQGSQCLNVPGSFECTCPPGFVGNASAIEGCIDRNECLTAPGQPPACGENAECVNTPGNYYCQCPEGYTGNAKLRCDDVDECAANVCGANSDCINTVGGYRCQCRQGFGGDATLSAGCTGKSAAGEGYISRGRGIN